MRTSAAATMLERLLLLGGAASVVPLVFAGWAPALASARPWCVLVVVLGAALWAKRRLTGEDLAQAPLRRGAVVGFGLLVLAAYTAATLRQWDAFEVNAYDFSLFDWMLENTSRGKFMWAPFVELPHFGVHRFYLALPLVPLHAWLETPYFLLLLHPLILWLGAWPLARLARQILQSDALAALIVAAYLVNGWTTSILNYSFHLEVCFLPLGFALLDAWTRFNNRAFWLWAVLLLAVKEDYALYLIAFGLGICVLERLRWRTGACLAAVAAAAFAFDMTVARPYFADGYALQPSFLSFWGAYGNSFGEIAWHMLTSPLSVAWAVLTSQWYVLFGAALFLPLLAPLAVCAMLPGLLLLGSSSNLALRTFGLYYSAPLLPFFFWGLLLGYRRLRAGRYAERAPLILALALAGIAFAKGSTLRFLPAHPELGRELDALVAALPPDGGPLCAQAALFPHLPYSPRTQALTEQCLAQPGSRALVNLRLPSYPYTTEALRVLTERRPPAPETPSGFTLR